MVAEGRVVVATRSRLLSLNADTGAVEWEQPGAGRPVGAVGDAVIVQAPSGLTGLRDGASGAEIASQVPAGALALAGLVVGLERSTDVAAWRVVR